MLEAITDEEHTEIAFGPAIDEDEMRDACRYLIVLSRRITTVRGEKSRSLLKRRRNLFD